jgi:hypothetical protein
MRRSLELSYLGLFEVALVVASVGADVTKIAHHIEQKIANE